MTNRIIPALTVTVIAALVLTSCGGDGDGSNVSCDGSPVDTAGVPELADGVLDIGSSIAYPPIDFYGDDGSPDGLDIDVADALGDQLCVSVEFIDEPFEELIGDLNIFDFDAVVSAMTITDERSQLIDFIPYANVGTSIIVRTGNLEGIGSKEDLCGKTIAVQLATIHEDFLNDLNASNQSCQPPPSGLGPADVLTFDVTAEAMRDVVTAGSEATITDFPAAFVYADEDPRLELVDVQICPQPYGIAVRQGSGPLNAAISEALLAIHDSGRYDEIMKKWDLGQARLELSEIIDSDGHEFVSTCDAGS